MCPDRENGQFDSTEWNHTRHNQMNALGNDEAVFISLVLTHLVRRCVVHITEIIRKSMNCFKWPQAFDALNDHHLFNWIHWAHRFFFAVRFLLHPSVGPVFVWMNLILVALCAFVAILLERTRLFTLLRFTSNAKIHSRTRWKKKSENALAQSQKESESGVYTIARLPSRCCDSPIRIERETVRVQI